MDKIFCCSCCKTGSITGKSIIKGKYIKVPRDVSVTEYFSRCLISGEINPDASALVRDGKTNYTFRQFDDKSTRLAKSIRIELEKFEWYCNNEDGDLVIAFCLGNTEIMIITMFAIIKLGTAYLALDPLTPEEHLVKIVAATRPLLIIIESHDPIISRFISVARVVHIMTITELLEKEKNIPNDFNDVLPLEWDRKPWERTAAIYYTSGTNGRRRGVRIGQAEILNRIMWQWDLIPYEEDDIACVLSQTVIHTSMPDIFAPLLNGTSVVILNKATLPNPTFLIPNISDQKVTRLTVSSTLLSSILTEIEQSNNSELLISQLSGIRCWVCCGDMLTKELCQRFFASIASSSIETEEDKSENREVNGKRIPKLLHVYGTTETTADATYDVFYTLSDVDEKSMDYQVPFGIPIANTTIYILSETQKNLPLDGIGEICVAGRCVAQGYVFSDMCSKFLPNRFSHSKDFSIMFRTGDLGRISADTKDGVYRLYHEGRCSSIIKMSGRKVDLNTLARIIRSTTLVEDVEVFLYHPDLPDQVIVAACILKHDVISEDVAHMIHSKIESYCLPEIHTVTAFPILTDGRMDRHTLMLNYKKSRTFLQKQTDWSPLKLPVDKMDVAKLLCEIVALSIVVPIRFVITNFEMSFWDLGGDSTNVILTVSRLRGKNYYMTLEDFICAKYLPAIMELMLKSQEESKPKVDKGIMAFNLINQKFFSIPLQESHMDEVLLILCQSYTLKEKVLLYANATYDEFYEFVSMIWKDIIKQNLSIVVKSKVTNEIVGVSCNVDANLKPLINIKKIAKPIKYALDVYSKCERNAKAHLTNSRGKLIEPYLMGTLENMTSAENTLLIQFLLTETIKRGLVHNFSHIFISNDAPILRQMCRNVLRCDIHLEFPISATVASDNSKPFSLVGGYHSVTVYSKGIK